jgi:hypothetical protein
VRVAPGLVKAQIALYSGGPLWLIQLASPVLPWSTVVVTVTALLGC